MKRKNLYWIISIIVYGVSAYIIGQYFTHDVFGGVFCAIPCIIIGVLIASAFDGYLSSRYPGFLYTPYEDKVKMVIERNRKRDSEVSKILNILETELLNPWTSLSWKYKLIGDFCYEHPRLKKLLKESERYITWRTDVIDWAKSNLYRIESFYFNDGILNYVFDSNLQTEGLIDLNLKYGYSHEPNYDVICDVDLKKKRLPKDYFEFPGIVWESENMDVDDYIIKKRHPTATEALSLGIGFAAGLELFNGGVSNSGGK